MKRIIPSRFIAILSFLILSTILAGQDIVYVVSGEVDNSQVALDSILFENLTNDTRLIFDDLPEQADYRINLSQQENQGSTSLSLYDINTNFTVSRNIPGNLLVEINNTAIEKINVTVFNIQAQVMHSKTYYNFLAANTINIDIGLDGVYLISLQSDQGIRTFKAIGTEGNGLIGSSSSARNSPGKKKSGFQLYQMDGDFSIQEGDNLRVSVYKESYYSMPQKFILEGSRSIVFTLNESTVDSYGISDGYIFIQEDNETIAYNDTTGLIIITGDTEASEVIPGNIITVDADTTGFLRKIVSVTEENGSLVLETEQAYLNDVFVNTSLNLDTEFRDAKKSLSGLKNIDIIEALTDDKGYLHPIEVIYFDTFGNVAKKNAFSNTKSVAATENIIDFYTDFAGTDLYGTGNEDVHFYISEGHASLVSNAIFELDFGFEGVVEEDTKVEIGDLISFDFHLDTEAEFQTTLALDMSKGFEKENTVSIFDFRKVTAKFIVPPGIPLWITFDCDIFGKYHFAADAMVNADWGFESNHSVQVSGEYDRATDSFTPISEFIPSNTVYPLNVTGEANATARLELYPRIDMRFYGYIGPYAEIAPYVQGNYNAALQSEITSAGTETFLAWNSRIDLGLDLRLGAELSFLGLYEKEFGPEEINAFETPLWSSPEYIELLSTLPVEAEAGSIHSLNFLVSDLIGLPVVLCPVYISGDGEFTQNIGFTDENGELSIDWTLGTTAGNNSFAANIYKADKTIIESIEKTVSVAEVEEIVAEFSASVRNIIEGDSIQFTDQSTNDPTSWSWDFGDGGISTAQNPLHTYSTAGTYSVTLQASNNYGIDSAIKTNYIVVSEGGSTGDTSTLTDYDGNTYNSIKIGTQWWMAENLKTTHYANGTEIPLVDNTNDWDNVGHTDKAMCYYDNSSINANTYGALYSWAAATNGAHSSSSNPNVQGVCPSGWHMPSLAEWTELADYLGGAGVAGSKMKETGTTHWFSHNTDATNESGFTALPGGDRDGFGNFSNLGIYANFWSSTVTGGSKAWSCYLIYYLSVAGQTDRYRDNGLSVRCIKD